MIEAAAVDTTYELLDHLRGLGVKLWVEEGKLRFRSPQGVLTPELRARIKVHKPAILDFLSEAQGGKPATPPIEPASRDGELPLSFAQERLWFLGQWQDDGAAAATYNVTDVVRLRGRFDPAILSRCLDEIVRRHEILRTVFPATGGQPCQVIGAPAPVEISAFDFTDMPSEQREDAAQHCLRELAELPFDLGQGPLLRAATLRLADQEHLLLISMHHIVTDGWSSGVWMQELIHLYTTFSTTPKTPAPLPPLPIQYADFAVWQRQWLESPALASQLEWWKERLGDAEGILELPSDRPRPTTQSFAGATHRFELATSSGLDRLAQRGTTRFMVLLAAYAAVLRRYSGTNDLLVATPVANRRRHELQGLVGFFVNTLVMRVDFAKGLGAGDFLEQLRDETLQAFEYQDVPFEKLVEELQPERDPGRPPLAQVLLVVQNTPTAELRVPGLTLEPLTVDGDTAKFDLSLMVTDGPSPLPAALEYATDLFDATTVQRLAQHLQTLLNAFAEQPAKSIADLPLVSPAEEHQLLREWNDTGQNLGEPTIPSLFAEQVRRVPEKVAVSFGNESWTYQELDSRSEELADVLREVGVAPEVPVPFYLERGFEMVTSVLAILKAGGYYVPLDSSYPESRLQLILAEAESPVLLTCPSLRDNLSRLPEASSRQLLEVDGEGRAMPPASENETPVQSPRSVGRPPVADNLAYVMYTSGSTGRPKGVSTTHRAVARLVRQTGYADFSPERVFAQLAPVAFDASTLELWGPLLNGGRLAILPAGPLSLREIGDAIATHHVDSLWLTAGLFHQMVDENPESLRPLRQLLAGGDVLSPAHVRRVLEMSTGGRVVNGYGPTEGTTFACCHSLADADSLTHSVPIGRPIGGTQAYVVDPDLRLQPTGVAGELLIAGDGLARGYLDQPRETAQRFISDPFSGVPGGRLYRTGDLARRRGDGTFDFFGRFDHQVKVRGFRIELSEIEEVLARHPGVGDKLVIARDDGEGKRLVAYVVAAADRDAPPSSELDELLRNELPSYMVPAAFVTLEALPLTPNGKVDRRALPAPRYEGAAGKTSLPRTQLETVLVDIWSDVCGLETVGIEDDFFALGGHSLLAIQVISRIERALELSLPVREFFENPTISSLATHLEEKLATGKGAALPPLERAPQDQPLPLSYSQERLWLFEQLVPGTSVYNTCRAGHLLGPLDLRALNATFNEILSRHEVLRTSYVAGPDGEPCQVVAPHRPLALPMVDLRGLSAERREAETLRLSRHEHTTPMDLTRPPLVRAQVLMLDVEEHVVLLSIHHICWDLGSGGVLLGELEALYLAFVAGRPSPLPDLPVQYADFAVWQRQWLHGEVLDAQIDYWRQHLADVESHPMVLHTDHPLPADESHRGASVRFPIAAETALSLRQLGQKSGATVFMTHLALFEALLYRYAPQPGLVVGTAISNRARQELEGVIGFFDNLMAMRTDTREAGSLGFADFLTRVREVALGAYAHQHLPFEILVRELRLERERNRTPLLRVIFLFQLNYPAMARPLAGLTMKPYQLELGTAKFDLTFALREGPDGLVGQLEYNTDLFDVTTMQRLVGHYRTLAASVLNDPARPLEDLPLLSAAEAHQLLVEWDTADSAATPMLIPERVHAWAREQPSSAAVVGADGDVLTYRALEGKAVALSRRLRALGVGPETRVGVCMDRSPNLIVALYAIWQAGGAYLPLDPEYPPARLDFMLGDAGVPVVLTEERLAGRVEHSGVQQILLDTMPEEEAVGDAPLAPRPAEQLAYVIYTSGSTGKPKGVEISHGSLRGLVDWHLRTFQLTAADASTHLAGLGFDASVWEVWPCLAAGARLALPDDSIRTAPEELLEWLVERRVTVSFLPTPLAESVLGLEWPQDTALRLLLTGGDRLRRRPPAGLPWTLINNYGPTESTVVATSGPIAPEPADRPPSIGRGIDGISLRVYDRSLRAVPVGIPGELVVGGFHLARGYLARPALTAERFVPDPDGSLEGQRVYRTGDLVRCLSNGEIDFLGRLDEQVKVRGFRIELGEIEATLARQPGVESCAVLAPEVAGARQLVAWVVADGPIDTENLRGALSEELPSYMVPAALNTVAELPLTANGKIDRAVLLRQAADLAVPREEVAPQTEMEVVLAGLWQDLLGRSSVGIHDDFFALGGHSLLATQLASRVHETLGVDLPLEVIFDRPTVAGLAESLEGSSQAVGGTASPTIVPTPRDQELPLSFAQERMWFLDQLQPGEMTYTIPVAVRLIGDLAEAPLNQAVKALTQRHESLRTTFASVDGRPQQRIAPPEEADTDLAFVDLTSAADRETALNASLAAELAHPFDLARGPLLRLRAYRTQPQEHILLIIVHHIVADGWSMGVIVRELSELYAAASAGRTAELPPLAMQYADFAAHQRQWLEGETATSQLAWWKERLAEAPTLDLPADAPPTASPRGGRHAQRLPKALATEVRALASRRSTSLFMTLSTAFALLLHRYTGLDDILIGYPSAGRRQGESQGLIGMFLNTLVLRARVEGVQTFEELLDRVRRAVLDADARQEIPFEKLLDELRPERDLARTPLFQVFFNMLSFPAPPTALGELALEAFDLGDPPAKFDLTLYASEDGDEIAIDWVYRADRFRPERIAVMAEQLDLILAQASSSDLPLAAINLRPAASQGLPDPEKPLPLAWNGSVIERLVESASREPDKTALTDGSQDWSYQDLDLCSGRIARTLAEYGVGSTPDGQTVAIYAERGAELAAALWGVLRAGAAFVILDAAYPTSRLLRQVRLAAPRAWILAAAEPPGELRDLFETLPVSEPLVPSRLVGESSESAPVEDHHAAVGPGDLAYLAFTSGSTGEPKAIEGPHAPLAHFVDWHIGTFGLTKDDRFSMLSGLAHDPLLRDVFTPLALGATLCVPSEETLRDPVVLHRWLAETGVTVAHMTPPLARLLVNAEPASSLPDLRYAFLSGAVLHGRDVEALRKLAPNVEVVNFYGATETPQGVAFSRTTTETPTHAPVPIGHGIDSVQLILETPDGRLAGVGEPAEICVRSPYLARGYRGDPATTAARFFAAPGGGERMYRTGDLGRYEPNGDVVFLGRRDLQVKIRGFRVELGEVERVLASHPDVRQAAVEMRPGPENDERLAAYLVTAADVQPEALRTHLMTQLPSYMVPSTFVVLDQLPLTPNGKLDRRALPNPWEEVSRDTTSGETVPDEKAPRSDTERQLAQIWEELLGVRAIGVDDHFFNLGGHSLLAVRLAAKIRQTFQVEIPVSALFETPILSALALRLEAGDEMWSPLVAIQPGTQQAAPFFCVHPIGGTVLSYAELASQLDFPGTFFGLQAPGLVAGQQPSESIDELAQRYLREIRARQQGPYYLGGWSMGGLIAWEMAAQLQAAGEDVAVLVLIDSGPVMSGRASERVASFTGEDPLRAGLGLEAADLPDLGGLAEEARAAAVWQLARERRLLPPEISLADFHRWSSLYQAHNRAIRGYRPAGYHGPTILLAAEERRSFESEAPRDLGWSEAGVELEPLLVPGNHYTMLAQPNVEKLAARLSGELRPFLKV